MKMTKENLIDILAEERMYNTLEDKLNTAPYYLEAKKEQRKSSDKLDKMKFTKKQMKAIDRAVSAANASGAEYGKAAYNLGFHDGVKLIFELKQFL